MTPSVTIRMLEAGYQPKEIFYGFAKTSFGEVLIGWLSEKDTSICHLHFTAQFRHTFLPQLQKRWPESPLVENTKMAEQLVESIFSESNKDFKIEVALVGTAFQQTVWEAILQIPLGEFRTYTEVAEIIGKRTAVMAIARTVYNNQVAYLIPCHRVDVNAGQLTSYRWGVKLKAELVYDEKRRLKKKKTSRN